MLFDSASKEAFKNSRAHGFWDEVPRNKGEMIALIHSEASELLEATRDEVVQESVKIPGFTKVEEELADIVIRVMDFSAGFGQRTGEAILAKMAYNKTRPRKHGRKF
jgi:NTP pyrophosphatase (non-canonical NTP hydrolase)